jgi:hypothetical protein
MLPVIRNYARGAFGHLKADLRQDLVQEVIANCMVAYVRLFKQGKVALAYPTVLARYAIAQVRDLCRRRVGGRRRGLRWCVVDPRGRLDRRQLGPGKDHRET